MNDFKRKFSQSSKDTDLVLIQRPHSTREFQPSLGFQYRDLLTFTEFI